LGHIIDQLTKTRTTWYKKQKQMNNTDSSTNRSKTIWQNRIPHRWSRGKEHKLVIWRGAVGVVEVLGWELEVAGGRCTPTAPHLLVGGDPPRRPSVLR
jgi:hypothetical protein